ncbi:MAG: hypothetical protein ABIB04_00950 [Patescibacteria group bacterium]
MNFLRKIFRKEPIYPEVVTAYFNKLPKYIQVEWFRDSNFIVGKIVTDTNDELFTQGRNPDDFVEMVNDAVYTAYDVRPQYIDVMHRTRRFYRPPADEWQKLNDDKVEKSAFRLEKRPVAV